MSPPLFSLVFVIVVLALGVAIIVVLIVVAVVVNGCCKCCPYVALLGIWNYSDVVSESDDEPRQWNAGRKHNNICNSVTRCHWNK